MDDIAETKSSANKDALASGSSDAAKQVPMNGWTARFNRKRAQNCACGADGSGACMCSPEPWFGVY